MINVDSISLENLNTSLTTNMSSFFNCIGQNSNVFTLNLGNNFDASNVTNMRSMFQKTGYSSTEFTLDLGSKFDASNVTNMFGMFWETGYSNSSFILDLSTFTFDNVTSYGGMFNGFKTTQKIYVKNAADQTWILDKGFSNLSTTNVLIKS